jgi:hypothetical protein
MGFAFAPSNLKHINPMHHPPKTGFWDNCEKVMEKGWTGSAQTAIKTD